MSNGLKMPQEKERCSWAVTGTEIFAFFNLPPAFATSLLCLGILLFNITESINHRVNAVMWFTCLGINLGALITFVFSVLLYLGIYKKITRFLLSYIVFGVVVDITLVSTLVAGSINANFKELLRYASGDIYDEPVKYAVIGICVVHILLLYMVYRAWFSIRSSSKDYQKLVDDSIWSTDLSKEVVTPSWLENLQEFPKLSAPKA